MLFQNSNTFAAFSLITAWVFSFSNNTPQLHLELHNLQEAKGQVYVAVYDRADAFLKPESAKVKKIVPVTQAGSLKIAVTDLPEGAYAVSCFHDLNGNGQLDKNLFGVPTEPYGFSNNARPSYRAPTWEEALFYLQKSSAALSVRLEQW